MFLINPTTPKSNTKLVENGDVVMLLPDRTKDHAEFAGLLSRPVVVLKSFTSKYIMVVPILHKQPKTSLHCPIVFDSSAYYASYQHLRVIPTSKLVDVKHCGKLSEHALNELRTRLVNHIS